MRCTSCGADVASGALCARCGAPTTLPVPADARFERRVLTVLFGDLVAFTAASDNADPEDVRAWVRPFHGIVRRSVAAAGGTVARIVGDGVMAVWGYPIAREDDALRAIQAGLECLRALGEQSGDRHARFGINTGEAIVAFGSEDEDADDAMGDAVNVAARLAAAAPVDGLLVGETTRRLAGDSIVAREAGPLALRGKSAPVVAWHVSSIIRETERGTAQAFAGRTAEIAALDRLLERTLVEGRAIRGVVHGEPGVGKSALLTAWRARVAHARTDAPVWLVGRCRDGAGGSVTVLSDVIRAAVGATWDDPAAAVRASLERVLPRALPDRDWLLERLAPRTGFEAADPATGSDMPIAFAALLGAIAVSRSVCLIVEDAHWADRSLLEILSSKPLRELRAPVLTLFSCRPDAVERHHELRDVDLELPLHGLDAGSLASVIQATASALTADRLDEAAIIARSGGNPLFAIELVRLLAQRPDLAAASAASVLPETVQAVIAARLDLLDATSLELLRHAAVIGERFSAEAVRALARLGTDVRGALDTLADSEFVRRADGDASDTGDDEEYAFRHALVRDVAYGQLTRAARSILHRGAAGWLTEKVARDRPDLAGAAADHDLEALRLGAMAGVELDTPALTERAADHLIAAAEHAAGISPEASRGRWEQALDVLPDADPRRTAALLGAGGAAHEMADHRIALLRFEAALAAAEESGDALAAGVATLRCAEAAWALGDRDRTLAGIQRSVEILELLAPSPGLLEALRDRTFVAEENGTPADVIRAADDVIDLARTLGVGVPIEILGRRAHALATQADRTGLTDLRHTILEPPSSDTSGHLIAIDSNTTALLYFGDASEAAVLAREGVRLATARGLAYRALSSSGTLTHVLSLLGAWDEALAIAIDMRSPGKELPVPAMLAQDSAFWIQHARDDPAVAETIAIMVRATEAAPFLEAIILAPTRLLTAAADGAAEGVRAAFHGLHLPGPDNEFDPIVHIRHLALARACRWVDAVDLIVDLQSTVPTVTPIGAAIHRSLGAHLDQAAGRHDAAAVGFSDALARWRSFGYTNEAAHASHALAISLAALARHPEAESHRLTALESWDRLGAGRAIRDAAEEWGSRPS